MTFPLAVAPLKCLYFETSSWKTKGFGVVVIPPRSGWDLGIVLLSKMGAWAAPLRNLQWFFSTPTRGLDWGASWQALPQSAETSWLFLRT